MSMEWRGQNPEIDVRSLYTDKKKPWRFVLLKSVTVVLSNGDYITIPRGYVTDFASVPRGLRGIVSTVGNHKLAVLIHDWLYDKRLYTRKFADEEMARWLKDIGCSDAKTYAMYYAVVIRGQKWWDRDTMTIINLDE